MITLKQAVEVLAVIIPPAKKNKAVLLTGLLNIQVVRTADVSDIAAIIFVRDKHPESDVLMAAKRKDIPVLYTKCTMFEACGRLYSLGLRGCTAKDAESR